MKRTPLVRKPKAKGNRYELRIRERMRALGASGTKRNLQSGGQGGGDLIESLPGFSIECKKRERLNIWAALAQAEAAAAPTETPLVIFARNRSRDYVAMPLDDFEGLLREQESLRESALF